MRHSSSNYRLVPVYNVLQDQHRFMCGDPCDNVLRVLRTAYIPFQLVFNTDMGTPVAVMMRQVCGSNTSFNDDWTSSAVRVQKDINNDGVDEWVYTFDGGVYIGVPAGSYYVEVEFPDSKLFYTEVFTHPGDCQNCGEHWYLEWSHSCDEKSLGDYSMLFKNELYIGETVLIRDGELESTISRKDGYGVETIIATDIRPKWTLEILGNSWMLDSMKFLKLYDQVYLKRSSNADSFIITNIEVTNRGDVTNDCTFPIRITFTKDVLVNTKCCESVYEQAPVPANCAGMQVMTSEDFTMCSGDTIELMATVIGGAAPFVYIWSNGQTGQTIEISPTEDTTLIITVVDAFGCTKQDTVTINVITCDPLTLDIVADPGTSVCEGASVDLDLTVTGGSGSYTYLWSTSATTQDISVTPTVTTVYSVTVTDTISGDVAVATKTITVVQTPVITIVSNECNMSASLIETCIEDPSFEWQIETTPDNWDPAPGINTGTTYHGVNGGNYRLAYTCNGCIGYSNEITVTCSLPCTTEITSVTFDSGENELSVGYATVLGSNPFISGYIAVYESLSPNLEDCEASSAWSFVINVTLVSESGTLVIPYIPANNPGCIWVALSINAGECDDEGQFLIS